MPPDLIVRPVPWNGGRRGPSTTFLCILAGFAVSVFGWFVPWGWPSWPARTLLDFYLAKAEPSVVSGPMKGVGWTVLLLVNAGFWALIAGGIVAATRAARRRGRSAYTRGPS